MRLSIAITTFEDRFEKFLIPLINSLVNQNKDDYEIMVIVNGSLGKKFNQEYRKNVLSFCSSKENVYPMVYTTLRGLSKLWNTGVVNSLGDYVLIMNDDVYVEKNFIEDVCKHIDICQSTFLINSSYSHFVVKRSELDEIGYFDERLLGFGEEDADFNWRYIEKFKRDIPRFPVSGVTNFVDSSRDSNVETYGGTKYSSFNRLFIYNNKYRKTPDALIRGFFDYPMECVLENTNQYPYEKFFIENKDKLSR